MESNIIYIFSTKFLVQIVFTLFLNVFSIRPLFNCFIHVLIMNLKTSWSKKKNLFKHNSVQHKSDKHTLIQHNSTT